MLVNFGEEKNKSFIFERYHPSPDFIYGCGLVDPFFRLVLVFLLKYTDR